jgi:hypothetical protein
MWASAICFLTLERDSSANNATKFTSGRKAKGILPRNLDETWRPGQLPGGQTAKAHPDYRVQSLPYRDMTAWFKLERHHNGAPGACLYLCEQMSGNLTDVNPLACLTLHCRNKNKISECPDVHRYLPRSFIE